MKLKAIIDVLATLLVFVAAGLVIWAQLAPAAPPRSRPGVEHVSGMLPADLATTVRGSGNVALVEFSDFECPFCGRHVRDVEPRLHKAFIDTGVVRQIFLNFPLPNHSKAGPASEAALCAGSQGKFWEMHDALFANQKALAASDLTDRATTLGLDEARFASCLQDGAARLTIDKHKRIAADLKVRSTPAFFIGVVQADGAVILKRRLNGALPFEEFHSAIMEVAPEDAKRRVRDVALNGAS